MSKRYPFLRLYKNCPLRHQLDWNNQTFKKDHFLNTLSELFPSAKIESKIRFCTEDWLTSIVFVARHCRNVFLLPFPFPPSFLPLSYYDLPSLHKDKGRILWKCQLWKMSHLNVIYCHFINYAIIANKSLQFWLRAKLKCHERNFDVLLINSKSLARNVLNAD